MDNTAINIFSIYFSSDRSKYEIDLSNASLVDVLQSYMDYMTRMHPRYTNKTIQHHLEYIAKISNHTIKPRDITDVFYVMYSQWLTNNGVKYSSQCNYMGTIKTCLEWGIRHGIQVSSTYDKIDLPKSETFLIALSTDEVSHIAHFDINTIHARKQYKKTLEKVRDMFCLSCNLGQRHSDMIRISKENFNRNIFTCKQQKTENVAIVNIDQFSLTPKWVYQTLEKYNYEAPYKGDINNFNKHLHALMQFIGQDFNEEYKIENKVNDTMIVERKKKWELIASHTARRTFVTYNAFRNVPVAELMKATGHKSVDCFSKYIKLK